MPTPDEIAGEVSKTFIDKMVVDHDEAAAERKAKSAETHEPKFADGEDKTTPVTDDDSREATRARLIDAISQAKSEARQLPAYKEGADRSTPEYNAHFTAVSNANRAIWDATTALITFEREHGKPFPFPEYRLSDVELLPAYDVLRGQAFLAIRARDKETDEPLYAEPVWRVHHEGAPLVPAIVERRTSTRKLNTNGNPFYDLAERLYEMGIRAGRTDVVENALREQIAVHVKHTELLQKQMAEMMVALDRRENPIHITEQPTHQYVKSGINPDSMTGRDGATYFRFVIEFEHAGSNWALDLWATDATDALNKFRMLKENGKVDGPVETISYERQQGEPEPVPEPT